MFFLNIYIICVAFYTFIDRTAEEVTGKGGEREEDMQHTLAGSELLAAAKDFLYMRCRASK